MDNLFKFKKIEIRYKYGKTFFLNIFSSEVSYY